MAQTSSDFVVKVSTQGVEQARRALKGLESATAGMAGGQAKDFAASAAQMGNLTQAIERMTARLERSTKVTHRLFRTQRDLLSRQTGMGSAGETAPMSQLPPSGSGAGGGQRPGRRSAMGTQQSGQTGEGAAGKPRQGFFQGLGLGALQGVLPGQVGFVQRGPGALGQILGQSLGNTAAQFGKAPFAGPGGITNAIGSIPLIGGALAAPLSNYMQQAEQVMSFQRQQVELAPLLGDRALDENLRPLQGARFGSGTKSRSPRDALSMAGRADVVNKLGGDSLRLLGRDLSAGQAFESSLVRGGAAVGDLNNRDYVRASMAAQTRFGVGAEVTGAFGLGARTGAYGGQKNADPAQMLLRAINQSNQLGLSGTEQQEYLQQIAEGIRNIERTGIPFQMDTVRNLQSSLTGFSGLSSRAAGRFAMGAGARAAEFMESGPSDAFDMNVFRRSGFKGGLASYYDTLEKIGSNPQSLAQNQIGELSNYARSPIRSKAVHDVRQMARRIGIVDPNFAQTFVESMSDPSKRDAAQADLAKKLLAAQGPAATDMGQAALTQGAEAMVPSAARRQAQMTDATLAAGGDSVNVMLNASEVANKLGNQIGTFGGVLNQVSNTLRSVGMAILGGDASTSGAPDVRPAH